MALTQETKLAEIEILDSGRVQFREETQIFLDGQPFGTAQYHRSGVDPGYLDENGDLVLYPLPQQPITKGLQTDIDLQKLLEAVRTPAVLSRWKAKLQAEREENLKRLVEEKRLQDEKRQAEQKRIDDENKRIDEQVQAALAKTPK